ncbi:MAG: hypothetical protein J6331_09510, partial [Lentisphaeria bacterium]|nr:hypothetical protein [Lentisphaeria bacterium]
MKRKLFFSMLLATGFFSFLSGAEFAPDKSFTAASYARKAPVVDGKISPDEYAGGLEQFGVLRHNSAFLSTRQAKFFAALDEKNLYLACQSEIPDPDSGVKLRKRYKKRDSAIPRDDCVEFLFLPPGATSVYHIILNAANVSWDVRYPVRNGGVSPTVRENWDPIYTAKSGIDGKIWTLELKIPLKEMGVTPTRTEAKWLFQFARSWKYPNEQSSMNKASVFADPGHMNEVLFSENSPSVRFTGMGDYVKGENKIAFTIHNPGPKRAKVKYLVSVLSEAAPRSSGDTAVLPAGASHKVFLNY